MHRVTSILQNTPICVCCNSFYTHRIVYYTRTRTQKKILIPFFYSFVHIKLKNVTARTHTFFISYVNTASIVYCILETKKHRLHACNIICLPSTNGNKSITILTIHRNELNK